MYQLTAFPNAVLRLADGALIPLPPKESEGYKYQAWLDEGNTPQPYVAPPPAVPAQVSRRQARQALLLAGLLDQVQPAIDAIADPTQRALMQIEWEDSQVFQRQRPALIQLAAAIGLSEAQLDELFIQAEAL